MYCQIEIIFPSFLKSIVVFFDSRLNHRRQKVVMTPSPCRGHCVRSCIASHLAKTNMFIPHQNKDS